jgi:hypothetical protein
VSDNFYPRTTWAKHGAGAVAEVSGNDGAGSLEAAPTTRRVETSPWGKLGVGPGRAQVASLRSFRRAWGGLLDLVGGGARGRASDAGCSGI